MNFVEKVPDRSQCDSAYSKLALMALCSVFMIAAIGKQLPANAADKKSQVVSVADLDLSTEEGMKAARERLHQTARKLCGQVVDPWSLSHHPDYLQCVKDTTTAAVAKLQGPLMVANAKSHAQGLSTR